MNARRCSRIATPVEDFGHRAGGRTLRQDGPFSACPRSAATIVKDAFGRSIAKRIADLKMR